MIRAGSGRYVLGSSPDINLALVGSNLVACYPPFPVGHTHNNLPLKCKSRNRHLKHRESNARASMNDLSTPIRPQRQQARLCRDLTFPTVVFRRGFLYSEGESILHALMGPRTDESGQVAGILLYIRPCEFLRRLRGVLRRCRRVFLL